MPNPDLTRTPNFAGVLRSAGKIRRQISDLGVKGGLTVVGGGQEPTEVACIFDFSGVSASPEARKMIALLEQQGCGCGSSGPDDVRCSCPD